MIRAFTLSDAYRSEIHGLIPGGAHTYSKGDDQFPALAPAAIVRGKGGRVWDLDGNEFVDCSMALGSVGLGHAYDPVIQAVQSQLERGSNFQRPASIELDLAREFISNIPGAERVKFSKNGSTATSAAVKLARAFTGRDLVAFPGNHPFYSYDDWFIGRTVCHNGIPEQIRSLSLTYDSTRPETLDKLYHDNPGRIACVITEPEEVIPGKIEHLQEVEKSARRHGSVFILDEMVTGYRAGWPGAHTIHGIDADLITWGKAIGNGFSLCALTGRADIMDLGGILQTRYPRVFLISTTHGGEAHAMAAALAVAKEYKTRDVLSHHQRIVDVVREGMKSTVSRHGLLDTLEIQSSSWRIVTVARDSERKPSDALKTLLMQEMIGRGVLFQGSFLPCYAHTLEDAGKIVQAFDSACAVYRDALIEGVDKFLVGPPIQPVFRKYNRCTRTCPSTPCPYETECHPSK